jgi:hypothetical protein
MTKQDPARRSLYCMRLTHAGQTRQRTIVFLR